MSANHCHTERNDVHYDRRSGSREGCKIANDGFPPSLQESTQAHLCQLLFFRPYGPIAASISSRLIHVSHNHYSWLRFGKKIEARQEW